MIWNHFSTKIFANRKLWFTAAEHSFFCSNENGQNDLEIVFFFFRNLEDANGKNSYCIDNLKIIFKTIIHIWQRCRPFRCVAISTLTSVNIANTNHIYTSNWKYTWRIRVSELFISRNKFGIETFRIFLIFTANCCIWMLEPNVELLMSYYAQLHILHTLHSILMNEQYASHQNWTAYCFSFFTRIVPHRLLRLRIHLRSHYAWSITFSLGFVSICASCIVNIYRCLYFLRFHISRFIPYWDVTFVVSSIRWTLNGYGVTYCAHMFNIIIIIIIIARTENSLVPWVSKK